MTEKKDNLCYGFNLCDNFCHKYQCYEAFLRKNACKFFYRCKIFLQFEGLSGREVFGAISCRGFYKQHVYIIVNDYKILRNN